MSDSTSTYPTLPPAEQDASLRSTAKKSRARVGIAGVLTLSVLAGGGAGVAGAAAWDAWSPDSLAPTSSTSTEVASASGVATDEDSLSADTAENKAAAATSGDVDTQSVAASVLPSVVRLDVSGPSGSGSGSGIVLTADGRILTNNHVVDAAGDGGTVRVSFHDGTRSEATVVGTDPQTDIAVVQVEDVADLTPAQIGESGALAVGQPVVAIGSPYGLDATVTSGIVSALDRPVNVGSDGNGNLTVYPAVQTDAAINPGNSGGPLVDGQGRVIGINSSIRSTASSSGQVGSIGLGFAIPIDEAMPIVEQIVAGETPTHARLGVSLAAADPRANASVNDGAALAEITPGSAADAAGLRSGDVITAIDGRAINDADGLIALVRSYRPDSEVTITFTRNGEQQKTDVTLGSDAGAVRS